MANDIGDIYKRLDAVVDMISECNALVRENIAQCNTCRPKVLGNGKEGYDARIARLEEREIPDGSSRMTKIESRVGMSRAFFVGTLTAVATLTGIVIEIASLLVKASQ